MGILLAIWVDPLFLLCVSHSCLGLFMLFSYTSEILFHSSISNNLLSSNNLLLHSVHFFFFGSLLLHQFLLTDLHLALEENLVFLSLVEPFEVVWLHSMGCEHRNLGGWVFCHKICVICVFNLNFLGFFPVLVHFDFSFLLLLSKDLVNSQCFLSVRDSSSVMLTLCLS